MKDNMERCPNCNRILKNNWCMHCGYMLNGEIIRKKPTEVSDIEIYLGDRYDKINRNKNAFLPFILGPFYFCYNYFLVFGLLFTFVEFFVCRVLITLFQSVFVNKLMIFIIWRIFFCAIGNIIYLWLCEQKIKVIKKIYKENYKEVLVKKSKHTHNILMVPLSIGLLIFIVVASILIYANLK